MMIYASTVSSAGQFITVLLIFVFVLAITYVTTRYIAGVEKNKAQGSNISVIETQRITQNKYIQIVRITDRYFAIAVCKDSVTMISEISGDSITEVGVPGEKFTFKEFLEKAKAVEKKEQE